MCVCIHMYIYVCMYALAPTSPATQAGPRYENARQLTAPSIALWPTKTRPQECWWTEEMLQGPH